MRRWFRKDDVGKIREGTFCKTVLRGSGIQVREKLPMPFAPFLPKTDATCLLRPGRQEALHTAMAHNQSGIPASCSESMTACLDSATVSASSKSVPNESR